MTSPAPMSQPETPQMPAPRSHTSMAVSLVILGLIVVGLGALAYVKFSATPAVSPTPTPSASASPSVTPSAVGVKTFTSQALGIRFNYLASQGDPVIESGDKVYVGGTEGQWVREFAKNSSDDIKTAITKKFLVGISADKCPIEVKEVPGRPGIQTAEIMFDFQPTGLDDPRIAASPCPADYRVTNGIRYFWMDAAHPSKFFFFSIGQYPISADGGEKMWQDTFEVIK